jgi:hypothetical protein
MDADHAAAVFVEVFVEICTRLDQLVETQRQTNELLRGLDAAMRDHLEELADAGIHMYDRPGHARGLGHLIPYGNNNVHPIAAVSSESAR